jgi:hypothetical protein
MAASEQLNELAGALAEAQGEFPSVTKTEEGVIKGTSRTGNAYEYKYSYADLATVVETVKPILAKHGLALSQFVSGGDMTAQTLTTYLLHKSGQFISHEMTLLLPKEDAQGQGSAITYARRYSYMSALGLVADEDDDGNAASKAVAKAPATAPKAAATATAKPTELITPSKLKRIRELFVEKGIGGEQATEFCQLMIEKPKPVNDADADKLIVALELQE